MSKTATSFSLLGRGAASLALAASLLSCSTLAKLAAEGGTAAARAGKAGGEVAAEAGQVASKAVGDAEALAAKAGEGLDQAGQQLGKTVEHATRSGRKLAITGADIASDVLLNTLELFSDTSTEISEWSTDKQLQFQRSSEVLKGEFTAMRAKLPAHTVTELEARFNSLEQRLRESATAATADSLQAVQREGNELVSRLQELGVLSAAPSASPTPLALASSATATPTPASGR